MHRNNHGGHNGRLGKTTIRRGKLTLFDGEQIEGYSFGSEGTGEKVYA